MIPLDDSLFQFLSGNQPIQLDLVTASTKKEFDTAFSAVVLEGVQRLERDSKKFTELDEDTLSSILAGFLQSPPFLFVTREENSNGHVDLTFRVQLCKPEKRVLGEAKIYDGYKYHTKGISQLICY